MIAGLLLGLAATAQAEPAGGSPQIGDTYEITMVRDSSEEGSDGSSGSSHDQDAISEKVISVRPDGLELEFDLPNDASAESRKANWQFPARVFKPRVGPTQLLNQKEIEGRLDRWLKEAGWSRSVCGHWIFTWTSFRIDCDPQSVIKTIEAFDLTVPGLRDGASYSEPGTLAPGTLSRKTAGPDGAVFSVELQADPDAVRRAEAETDVAVGEIMRKPVTLEEALRTRAKEAISGSVVVTFSVDRVGKLRGKTTVTKLNVKDADGRVETRTVTQTVERKVVSDGGR